MPQSLIRLPETAAFVICGLPMWIEDHKIVETRSCAFLFSNIMDIIKNEKSDIHTLREFEKYGISFEAAIECCVYELEHDTDVFAYVLAGKYKHWKIPPKSIEKSEINLSKSAAGRMLADQFIEKIRSCNDWGELYEELHPTSKFCVDMLNTIDMAIICLRE